MILEDILDLNWKQQITGSRPIIELRFYTVSDWIDRWSPVMEEELRLLSTAPIDGATADKRIDVAFGMNKMKKAIKARHVLEKELQRRGEVQVL